MHWIAIVAVLLLLAAAGQAWAEGWWNEKWQYRSRIGFDTTATGADIKTNLAEIPVLVRLHSGNFNFTNTNEKGDDIRFVAADNQTLLQHHIEKYDPIDEVGYIWVKLPRLSGGVATDFIWMYYGSKEAAGGQNSAGTYDAAQTAVYHLCELEGGPRDASSYNNHITDFAGGQGLPAVVGLGMAFNGGGDHLTIAAAPSLAMGEAVTFSTWVRIAQPQQETVLFQRRGQGASAIEVRVNGTHACFQIIDADGQTFRTEECLDLPLSSWHHVAFTARANNRMAIYMDGLEVYYMGLPIPMPVADGPITIAAASDGTGPFIGDIDEIQLANVDRSADWVRAAFKSQGAEATLVNVLPPETGGGGGQLDAFIATTVQVVRNITLDGWVIIGVIFIMGGACTVVFMNKSVWLWSATKENKTFLSTFATMTDPLASVNSVNGFANSNLFRLFDGGCQVFKQKAEDAAKVADEMEMKSFKAALERSYVEETKRLNAGMLMLTMSITGAPFLGLLGTVWGVMSTFAAMAEAGEANIAAIAPGVASALATTVAGLLVAIPALFAYNYLFSRVKEISADLVVFIDQFAVKMERRQGGAA
jgi:biopolymer transport protein ExbB